jgi:hypothetical protein
VFFIRVQFVGSLFLSRFCKPARFHFKARQASNRDDYDFRVKVQAVLQMPAEPFRKARVLLG